MPSQRACDAENQARNKLSNGPRRVQSNDLFGVFCDVTARVSCRGYACIRKVHGSAVNQGGTAKSVAFKKTYNSSLTVFVTVGDFLFFGGFKNGKNAFVAPPRRINIYYPNNLLKQ